MSYSQERDVSFQGGDADVCVGEEASNFEIETLFIGGRRPQATLLPPRVTTVSAPTPEVRGPPPPPHPASYGPDATYEVHPQGSSQGPRSPAHAPQFKYGIVAAVAGRAHLREKTESIKSLLQAYRIEDGEWFGQVGFRLDAGEKKNGVDLHPLNQEIGTIFPFYGTIKFTNSTKLWDLESHRQQASASASVDGLLVERCSRPHEAALLVDEPEKGADNPPLVSMNISAFNFAKDTDYRNHFTTSAAFTLEKENGAKSDQFTVKFSSLKFSGPSKYTFQGASTRITLDQPSGFDSVSPEERFEVNSATPYKDIVQDTTKAEEKQTARVELGTKTTKVGYEQTWGSAEDHMRSIETMRNAWEIRHLRDTKSKTIRYFMSRSGAFSRQNSLPDIDDLRPSMKFRPEVSDSPPKTMVVRMWSLWVLDPQLLQSRPDGIIVRAFKRLLGKGRPRERVVESRIYTNVAHCVEAIVPLDFVGIVRKTEEKEDVLEELGRALAID